MRLSLRRPDSYRDQGSVPMQQSWSGCWH